MGLSLCYRGARPTRAVAAVDVLFPDSINHVVAIAVEGRSDRGIMGVRHQTHFMTLDSGTEHELCSCPVLSCGELDMVRAVVEEAATLASLAFFLGMIAIWAQVIATL